MTGSNPVWFILFQVFVEVQRTSFHFVLHNVLLAQLVEHTTFNRRVVGSNPTWHTGIDMPPFI